MDSLVGEPDTAETGAHEDEADAVPGRDRLRLESPNAVESVGEPCKRRNTVPRQDQRDRDGLEERTNRLLRARLWIDPVELWPGSANYCTTLADVASPIDNPARNDNVGTEKFYR